MIEFNLPEYVCKGLLELLFLIVGGLFVGWITHTYFARKAAIAEVEGKVMKTRLSIYEDLYKRLSLLLAQEILPTDRISAAVNAIKECGFEFTMHESVPTLTIMHTAKDFKKTYLELDTYINHHRLYLETQLDKDLLLFSNYFAIYRRLQVMYEEQLIDRNLSLDDANAVTSENLLMTGISILYQDEFSSEVLRVLAALKTAINTPMQHKRKAQDHTLATFGDDGIVVRHLKQLRIFQQKSQIQHLIAHHVALALSANKCK